MAHEFFHLLVGCAGYKLAFSLPCHPLQREYPGAGSCPSNLVGGQVHFGQIPFGWPSALVRLVLAAMFRGGAVVLEPEDTDQQIYDFTGSGVDGYFTGVNKFKKTKLIPTSGGLTPTEVKDAITALVEMDETGVQESANAIAARLKTKARSLVAIASAAEQKVQDTNLPLGDAYKRTEPVTAAATGKRDPVAAVRGLRW